MVVGAGAGPVTAIRRAAWVVLAGLSALFALFGLADLLIGVKFDETMAPAITGLTLAEIEAQSAAAYRLIDHGARGGGITLMAMGLVLTTVALVAYRSGQRWAWWMMWLLPGWALAVLGFNLAVGFVAGEAPPQALASAPPIAAIAAVALLVDVPRFRRTPRVVEALATD